MSHILEAVYDGPIDNRSFAYQPVILEKLPGLADGDAELQPVLVSVDDRVVDVNGDVASLKPGVRIYPSGCSLPECAVEYSGERELRMDRLVVRFKLLSDLTWSDGSPITARDSVYSFGVAASPDSETSKFKILRTASYEALDELTVQWTGLPGFLDQTYFLNFWMPLPEHIWGKFSPLRLREAEISSQKPMGWGPYVINEWVQGDHISLQKNPYYFRSAEGLPKFDQLIYRFIGTDPITVSNALLFGECDLLDQEASFNLPDEFSFSGLLAHKQLQVHITGGTVFEYFIFDLNPIDKWQGFSSSGAFQDPRLRQAVTLCMDRQRVVDEVFFGQSQIMNTYLPYEHPLYNPDVPRYTYDPQAGSALLEEIGWIDHDDDLATPRISQGIPGIPDGTFLEFTYLTTPVIERQKASEILASSLAQCGIKVELQYLPADELYAAGPGGPLFGRQFDMAQIGGEISEVPLCDLFLSDAIPGDPADLDEEGKPRHPYGWGDVDLFNRRGERLSVVRIYPLGWGLWNTGGYSNPEYDQVCKAALATLPGQPGYVENHLKAQEIFARDLPAIPLYARLKFAATRPDLCGFILDPTADSEMWNIEEFDYGPGCQ